MIFPVNITVPYIDNLEQRGYADMIEKLVAQQADTHKPDDMFFVPARSKRSIEDFSYQGKKERKFLWYDVKSFDACSDFSMPNLISIDRLRKVLSHPNQDLIYIFVHYRVNHTDRVVVVDGVEFRPVYEIDPSVLAIQNLGKGVLQIKNMHKTLSKYSGGRESWMKEVSKMAVGFYDNQIAKFARLKATWN